MGVHESQSLLWERMVALSPPFAAYLAPKLKAAFPQLPDFQVSAVIPCCPPGKHVRFTGIKTASCLVFWLVLRYLTHAGQSTGTDEAGRPIASNMCHAVYFAVTCALVTGECCWQQGAAVQACPRFALLEAGHCRKGGTCSVQRRSVRMCGLCSRSSCTAR